MPIEIQKIWFREANWWFLACGEREPFNATIKKIEGRRWSATHRAWLLPFEKMDIDKIIDLFGEKYEVQSIQSEATIEKETIGEINRNRDTSKVGSGKGSH